MKIKHLMKNCTFVLLLISGLVFGQLKKITQSEIRWKAYKSLKAESLSHYGTIRLKSGAVLFKNEELQAGTFIFDMNAIDAEDMNANPKQKRYLENHLKSDDFLDVAQYPTARFKITGISKNSGLYNYIIIGKLTIRDKTKTISFPAKIFRKGNKFLLNSDKFTFNRHDFGMNYDTFEDMLISDDVEMKINLTAG